MSEEKEYIICDVHGKEHLFKAYEIEWGGNGLSLSDNKKTTIAHFSAWSWWKTTKTFDKEDK